MPIRKKRVAVYIPYHIIKDVTFRNTDILRRFISGQNKILPRRKTGLSAKGQRHIASEIKRAREMGMLGYRGQ
ncbi:MAG: 30S ribosomal protein S18 [Candidatus Andersenbacteria bacterium]